MSWAKLCDGFHLHPKIVRAGAAATGTFARSLSYAAAQLTDGFLPLEIALILAWNDEAICHRLVEVGLWEAAEGGYRIHDFLSFNPSSKQVKRERRATALRVKRWRSRNTVTNGMRNGGTNAPPVRVTGRDGTGTSSPGSLSLGSELPEEAETDAARAREEPDGLMALWNECVVRLPRARGLTPQRIRHCAARLQERPLAEWREVILRMDTTPFLCGENDRGWKADFAWLIESPGNALKVLEGRYDRSHLRVTGKTAGNREAARAFLERGREVKGA